MKRTRPLSRGKLALVFLSLFLLYGCGLARAQLSISGKVSDTETGIPVPYVNIGVIDAGVGTVSNEKELFELSVRSESVGENAIVLFSSLGYEDKNIPLHTLLVNSSGSNYVEVALDPKIHELPEVIVSNKGDRFIDDGVGYRNYGDKVYGYWKDQIALGGELATKIIIKKGLRKLKRFDFEVWANPSDSLLLRVNFYKDDGGNGKPGTNLNTSGKNILCMIQKESKLVSVALDPFDIFVYDDFMVSLELLKVYGDEMPGFVLAASLDRYGSYRRYASQDKWERIGDTNMAYYLHTSLFVDEKVAQRYDKKQRKKRKNTRVLSGFVICDGQMLSNVTVTNSRTKERVRSDTRGRYAIAAKKNDLLQFSGDRLQTVNRRVGKKRILNVVMAKKGTD
ncbi:MAG: carboxypeptidase-like regulatory domain-containing protein [Bacteroidota bacterium]